MFFLKELPTRQMLESYQQRYPEMAIDSVEAALHMLRKASLLMRRLDTYFAQHELSQLRFLILVVLDREEGDGGLMASDMAERLDVSRPVMTRTVQTLAADGMLRLREHGADGRARLIQLTSKGRRLLHQALPGYYREIDDFMRTT